MLRPTWILTFQTSFKGRITKIDYNQLESGDRTSRALIFVSLHYLLGNVITVDRHQFASGFLYQSYLHPS